ncbi:MAG: sigma-70 family RNA polymerase sigma factor [Clostridia bacterium]|nr:sigma-70 family RNA polymerase sigma factor [Clostridia bacterium]
MDDAKIISLFFERSEQALAETERKYGKYGFSIARGLLFDDEDVKECVSDALHQLWNAIPPARPENLKLYFARVVRNLAINRRKAENRLKRGGGQTVLPLDEVSDIAANLRAPSDIVEETLLRELLNAFLSSLPARDRAIFVLRYFSFWDTARLASHFGLRENNVTQILSRTRKKLREYLEKEGYQV